MTLHSDTLAVEGDLTGLFVEEEGGREVRRADVKTSPSSQSDMEASIAGPIAL